MDIYKINQIATQGMFMKRSGNIKGAINLVENTLKNLLIEGDRSKNKTVTNEDQLGIAILCKSLGKLYFLDHDYEKAKVFYYQAIESYYYLNAQAEFESCIMHLGCCTNKFLHSQYFRTYQTGLQVGGESIDDAFSFEVIKWMANLGIETINNHDPKLNIQPIK